MKQEVEEMAIVATYQCTHGIGMVDDSYLRSHTPEQIQRNREEFEKVCWQIIHNNQMRALQAQEVAG